jgi:arabinogalactan endo-1,4-beta-galactosidase
MRLLKTWLVVLIFLAIPSALSQAQVNFVPADPAESAGDSIEFINGADLSFLPQLEDLGGIYCDDNGDPQDAIQIFKDHAFNYVRLKLWHSPAEDYNNLNKILLMAARIKNHGMKILLDFHYSDTWADPGKQTKPAAWAGLSFETLQDSVYQYTKKVIQELEAQGTLPDMVQLGNEINSGILWNDGRVGGSYDTPQQWSRLGTLLNKGIRGIRESGANGDSVKIMIHIANAANNSRCRWFFDNITDYVSDFDFIGLSFYPWWHGTLAGVKTNLNDLAVRYNKDILLAEMAYPWTLEWHDTVGNIVGSTGQLHAGYPATISGQTNYIRELLKIVRGTVNQSGQGVFYWAPDWISVPPVGSSWENVTLFDFSGKVLNSMDVFLEKPVELTPINVILRMNSASHWDTLQSYHVAQIRGEVRGNSYATLPDGKQITWDADCDLIMDNTGGDYWQSNFQLYPQDTLIFKFWTGYSINQGTYLRLGWEGPIIPAGGFNDNKRIIIAGETDTVITLEFYNSAGIAAEQYWRPFETKADSAAIFFRVNLSRLMQSGRFDPQVNGPVTVRGDADLTGGQLDWDESRLVLQREEYSIDNGAFWSGACYLPATLLNTGDTLHYKFYIENDTRNGWENNINNRTLIITQPLVQNSSDTTLHWVYFDEADPSSINSGQIKFLPEFYCLGQNFPNPFNNQTMIQYRVGKPGFVSLRIYDIAGQVISTLVQENQPAGLYSLAWLAQDQAGRTLPSGIYFIRLDTAAGQESRKALLLK